MENGGNHDHWQNENAIGALLRSIVRRPRYPLRLRTCKSSEPNLGSSNTSGTEGNGLNAVQEWLNAGSPPSGYSVCESQGEVNPNRLAVLLQPHAQPQKIVLVVFLLL